MGSVLRIILGLLLTFESAIAVQLEDTNTEKCREQENFNESAPLDLSRASIPEIDRFLRAQRSRSEGVVGKCNAIEGHYIADPVLGVSGPIRIENLERSELPFVGFDGVLSAAKILEDRGGEFQLRGLLIEQDEGWLAVTHPDPNRLPYATMYPISSLYLSVRDSLQSGEAPDGIRMNRLDFKQDMTEARIGSETALRFDSRTTVRRFLDEIRNDPRNFISFDLFSEVRIPPEIYELSEDPDYVRAKETLQHGLAIDLIWKKALEISEGDPSEATLISYMVTSIEKRGPCGAFYGLRGREFLPQSLFDREAPSPLKTNRLDAAQHFFASAVLAQVSREPVANAIAANRENFYHWTPRLLGTIRETIETVSSHLGLSRFLEDHTGGLYESVTRDRKAPPRVDTEIDTLYNLMGVSFGRSVLENEEWLPSDTINAEEFESEKTRLGVQVNPTENWQAFDPYRENPNERRWPADRRLQVDDSLVPEKKADAYTEAEVILLRDICRHSNDDDKANRACHLFNNVAGPHYVDQLYRRYNEN